MTSESADSMFHQGLARVQEGYQRKVHELSGELERTRVSLDAAKAQEAEARAAADSALNRAQVAEQTVEGLRKSNADLQNSLAAANERVSQLESFKATLASLVGSAGSTGGGVQSSNLSSSSHATGHHTSWSTTATQQQQQHHSAQYNSVPNTFTAPRSSTPPPPGSSSPGPNAAAVNTTAPTVRNSPPGALASNPAALRAAILNSTWNDSAGKPLNSSYSASNAPNNASASAAPAAAAAAASSSSSSTRPSSGLGSGPQRAAIPTPTASSAPLNAQTVYRSIKNVLAHDQFLQFALEIRKMNAGESNVDVALANIKLLLTGHPELFSQMQGLVSQAQQEQAGTQGTPQ